ncbi:hypothetical protein EJ08DRAFT_163613 [Tothia fuscella]|uniref:SART-1 protein n=1 Tax=Tothia fuscella TaxID=1048955 RepID=A0A9P4U0N6_9PEZI|nr:hypothetical protein EJ08DRAFT_163613 [Tothia fuscella]
MAESIGLEEANRIRIAMGLKPIPVPGGPVFKDKDEKPAEDLGSTLETRAAAAQDNWQKLQDEADAKKKRQEIKERIKKERDAAARKAKLVGPTLGEIDDDVDTSSWLKSQNKRVKRLEKEAKLAAERESRKTLADYTAADLAGVKVGHELGQFDAGSEQILTLKDAEIGEESEDDELEAVDLRDKERAQKRVDAKKKKPVYNPFDVDDGEKSILAQYDEEIEGEKRQRFTLDGKGSTREQADTDRDQSKEKSKGVLISLDILKDDAPISDYKDISEIKIRKPKKKKAKTTRKKNIEADDIFPVANGDDAMEVDSGAAPVKASKKRSLNDADLVDDKDLQSQLAMQRREALKKRKKVRPADLARQMKEEEAATMDGILESVEDDGLVIDETTEFVQNLRADAGDEEQEEEQRRRHKSTPHASHTPPGQPDLATTPDADGDVGMQESYAAFEEQEEAAERAKRAPSDDVATTGLEAESTLDRGLGATLGLLKQRGLLNNANPEDANATFRAQQSFLAERRNHEDEAERLARIERERDRASGRLDRMSAREREEYAQNSNNQREFIESRKLASMFDKDYKPNVELKYVDEFGRSMNQKEAFKHLSHEFHGKGSGKQKHEKRLKKIASEMKKEAASALDSSQHVGASAMGDRARKNKQAGVRLQ